MEITDIVNDGPITLYPGQVFRVPGPKTVMEIAGATSKASNPKDAIAGNKVPFDLVPDTLPAYAALAFVEGATKYGAYNWRVAGVRASVYKAAAERHLKKYWNGEWADPVTGVPHLASVLACVGIILDANVCNKLVDDRPPAIPLSGLLDGMEESIRKIKEVFKDKNPKHYTAKDFDEAS